MIFVLSVGYEVSFAYTYLLWLFDFCYEVLFPVGVIISILEGWRVGSGCSINNATTTYAFGRDDAFVKGGIVSSSIRPEVIHATALVVTPFSFFLPPLIFWLRSLTDTRPPSPPFPSFVKAAHFSTLGRQ